jgi:hypothetical protein
VAGVLAMRARGSAAVRGEGGADKRVPRRSEILRRGTKARARGEMAQTTRSRQSERERERLRAGEGNDADRRIPSRSERGRGRSELGRKLRLG